MKFLIIVLNFGRAKKAMNIKIYPVIRPVTEKLSEAITENGSKDSVSLTQSANLHPSRIKNSNRGLKNSKSNAITAKLVNRTPAIIPNTGTINRFEIKLTVLISLKKYRISGAVDIVAQRLTDKMPEIAPVKSK